MNESTLIPALRIVEESAPEPDRTVRLGGGHGLISSPAPAAPATPGPEPEPAPKAPPEGPPGPPAHATDWTLYSHWRASKCPVRDLSNPSQRLEEIDQATHEFVGECAELAETIQSGGPDAFLPTAIGGGRDGLIDEAGDCYFTGVWLIAAHGESPLALLGKEADDLGADDYQKLPAAAVYISSARTRPEAEWRASDVTTMASSLLTSLFVEAGKLCDHFKKVRYQNRQPGGTRPAVRVKDALLFITGLLALAGASPSGALAANIAKLDARYPDGFRPGGGERNGKGK